MKTWLASVLVIFLAVAGCGFFNSARITEMVAGMSTHMDKLECWVTVELKKYPGGIDPGDIKIRFSSTALEQIEEFGWDYIAANDVISRGFGKGFDQNTQSSPENDPPLNVPIKVKYPLHAKTKLAVSSGETLTLKAELFWGGKKVDSDERTIEHAYGAELPN